MDDKVNSPKTAGTPKTARSSDQRDRILAAATGLLAERGAEGLRVRDIAAAADCSTMGVYSHFGGKQGLIEAIFIDGFERFEAALRAEGHGDDHTRIARSNFAYRDWAFANPGAYAVMFTDVIPGFKPSPNALGAAFRAFQVVLDMVVAAQEAGRIRAGDSYQVAHTVWATNHGLIMIEFAGMASEFGSARDDAFYAEAMAAVMRGFAPA